MVVGPRAVSPSMPPLTQRKPPYLTISTVFGSGCPRSGKVVTTPMLLRKSVTGRAVVATGVSAGGQLSTTLLKSCSSKLRVPRSTSRLKEAVVVSLNLTVVPAPLFQSLLVMLQDPSGSRRIVSRHRPPPSRTEGCVASISSGAQLVLL